MSYAYDRDNIARASDGPGDDAYMITPANSLLAQPVRALYITGAGDIAIITRSGASRTLTVPANFSLPVGVTQVSSTGTTATGIIGIV